MSKDNVDLICSIGELAACFERSHSLADFLREVVRTVATHMHAGVCSIYLFDDVRRDLVLAATEGLSQDAVGQVRLRLGEGITGTAVKELRPVLEQVGSRNPNFKFFQGINEEAYDAFLAVPILRGISRVGALVIQHEKAGYFGPTDVKALRAIAAQLANVIEHARLLMRIGGDVAPEQADEEAPTDFIRATPCAPGIGVGHSVVLDGSRHRVLDDPNSLPGCANATAADFEAALRRTEVELESLQTQMEQRMADLSAALIFAAHLLILKDPGFSGRIRERIEAGTPPGRAIAGVVGEYVALFSGSPTPALQEKVHDVLDLGYRLLLNLGGNRDGGPNAEARIVVSPDPLPSDMMRFAAEKVAGLILLGGHATAHVAILARSLEIPMVIADPRHAARLRTGARVVIDGGQGHIVINPDPEVVAQYEQSAADRRDLERLGPDGCGPAASADGVAVELLANINLLSEVELAHKLDAAGVGLYRTEFPFIIRSDFPSEEEQVRVYGILLERMSGLPVTFRTLDVGGDKMLSYFAAPDEPNPFLGLRAIRFSLAHRGVFVTQLRALLRAGLDRDLRIMFPMIGSVDDFRQARGMVETCQASLAAENAPHNPAPKLGVMVELPAAVELAPELAEEADFLSIGSNDLVQYTLAVDRTNRHLADYYTPHHPAVLRALRRVADAARLHGTEVSFCGDMATDPRLLPLLLGIGFRCFSVDVRALPRVRNRLAELEMPDCEAIAQKALACRTINGVADLLGIERDASDRALGAVSIAADAQPSE